jgi:cell division septum initiation protein DivIVA
MSDFPRWERESQEDLSAPAPEPEATAEFDLGLELDAVDDDVAADDNEEAAEPRLTAARESLLASRQAARESLSATADSARESLSATVDTLSTTAARVGRWFASLDRRPEYDDHIRRDPIAELAPGAPYDTPDDDAPVAPVVPVAPDHAVHPDAPEHADGARPARFPLALRGYEREAVDAHLARLETENARLREQIGPPVSITEEIERLGEQTASILVVAHDKAHETARNAQAQAARAVSDAARDAERITAEAERRLRELDDETDAVWRERERLLADVREVSVTLAALADAASERFPPAESESEPAMTADVTPEPVATNAE